MNWDVNWSAEAEQELAALWLDTTIRDAVSRASRAIDQRLESSADTEGESRGGWRRITFEAPLVVTFLVDKPARTVRVTNVRRFGRA